VFKWRAALEAWMRDELEINGPAGANAADGPNQKQAAADAATLRCTYSSTIHSLCMDHLLYKGQDPRSRV
jgi:hypothetical protein